MAFRLYACHGVRWDRASDSFVKYTKDVPLCAECGLAEGERRRHFVRERIIGHSPKTGRPRIVEEHGSGLVWERVEMGAPL